MKFLFKSLLRILYRRYPRRYDKLRLLYYDNICIWLGPFQFKRLWRIWFNRSIPKRSKSTVALHTVFIARENIIFLREWLEYYRLLGVSEFYLYDNSGIQRADAREQRWGMIAGKVNKRKIPYAEMITLTDEEINGIMADIQHEVPGVHYVKWSPTNKNGQVTYEQVLALNECQQKLSGKIDWVINCDMDEFLVIANDSITDIPALCSVMEAQEYDAVLIGAIRMIDRWWTPDDNIINTTICPGQSISTFFDKKKYLYRPDQVASLLVHDISHVDTRKWLRRKDGFFLHYNGLPSQALGSWDQSRLLPKEHLRDQINTCNSKYMSSEWKRSILDTGLYDAWKSAEQENINLSQQVNH